MERTIGGPDDDCVKKKWTALQAAELHGVQGGGSGEGKWASLSDSQASVELFYRVRNCRQTVDFARGKRSAFARLDKARLTVPQVRPPESQLAVRTCWRSSIACRSVLRRNGNCCGSLAASAGLLRRAL